MSGSDDRSIYITFEGEDEPVAVRLKPFHLMLSEEKFGIEKSMGINGMMYAAYKAMKSDIPFKTWAQTVDAFDHSNPARADEDGDAEGND